MKKNIRSLYWLSIFMLCMLSCVAQCSMAHSQVTTIAVQYCTVHAHIIGSDGPPLCNAAVSLLRKGHAGQVDMATTDKNGDVSFKSVSSNYVYFVTAEKDDYSLRL